MVEHGTDEEQTGIKVTIASIIISMLGNILGSFRKRIRGWRYGSVRVKWTFADVHTKQNIEVFLIPVDDRARKKSEAFYPTPPVLQFK